MSEKRFEVVFNEFDEIEYIMDKETMEDRDFAEFMDFVESLAKNSEHWVFVDVDNERGCNNCKHEMEGICEVLNCGTHGWLDGVSECGLEYWESVLE